MNADRLAVARRARRTRASRAAPRRGPAPRRSAACGGARRLVVPGTTRRAAAACRAARPPRRRRGAAAPGRVAQHHRDAVGDPAGRVEERRAARAGRLVLRPRACGGGSPPAARRPASRSRSAVPDRTRRPRRERSSRPSSSGADGRAQDRAVLPRLDRIALQRILRALPSDRGSARGSVVVVLASAGAADHDLVFLDRDLDGAVARPVLGVDGIVLDGGVQPQAVALLAVVEGALERTRGRGAAARRPPRRRRRAWVSRRLRPLARRPAARPPLRRPCARPLRRHAPLLRPCGRLRLRARRRSARRLPRAGPPPRSAPPFSSTSGSRPCSRLKAWICWTVTSSWCAIHASVRPCRTHPRIWLS